MNCFECKDFFCKHRSQSTAGGECFYESKEQMEKLLAITTEATLDYVDWASFRREAAKDILAGWYSNPDSNEKSFEQMAKMAIEQADELIKQLKEEKA